MTTSPPVPDISFASIDAIFTAQQANRHQVAATTASERIAKLKRLKESLVAHRENFQKAVFDDFKKPAPELDLIEIYPLLQEIKHVSKRLRRWMRPKRVSTPLPLLGTSSHIQYEPKGVALIISPWNFPLQLSLSPLISAIAAGNTAILKPSEFTPHTSAALKKMLLEIFPENEVAVVEGGPEVAQHLLTLKFDHIFFTGSPQVGKLVMKAAAEHLTSVTLELGGKSPVIIDQDADIEAAARRIAAGKLSNCGQICVAPDYALVHESNQTAFVEAYAKNVEQMYGATDEARLQGDYTRIVNAQHTARLKDLLEDAVQKGATVLYGGSMSEGDHYFSPTVLGNVKANMRVASEEIFGPILPILTFSKLEEAIAIINEKEKPLAMYIFSSSKNAIRQVLHQTSAGGVTINDVGMHFYNYHLPFGGVNHSGIGKGHGEFAFQEFSNAKAVLKQWSPKPAIEMMYPPFTSRTKKIIEWVLKYF